MIPYVEYKLICQVMRQAGHLLLKSPTTGTEARDVKGKACDCLDPEAVTFCLVGALFRTANDTEKLTGFETVKQVCRFLGVFNLISAWEGANTNDETRKEIARSLVNYG